MQKKDFSPLNQLDCISRIFPIKGAFIVGAGRGEGAWFELLRTSDAPALLIEADAGRARQLDRDCVDHSNWVVMQQVIAADQKECTFNLLSNPSESTLLPVEVLTDLWPNMKLKQQSACRTVTVSDLLQQVEFEPNWLIVDCLPGLPVLHGAEVLLPSVNVVIVRVLAGQSLNPMAQSSHEDVDAWLRDKGFVCLGLTPERHPALAHAVYVRDYAGMAHQQQTEFKNLQKQIEQLNLAKTNAEQQNNDLQLQLALLNKAGEEQTRLASEHQLHIEHLTEKLDEQTKQAEECQQLIVQLSQSLDEKTKLIEEQQQMLDELGKTKFDAETLASELKGQISELTNAKDEQAKLAAELQTKFIQADQAKSEVDQLVTQYQQQIDQLTQSLDEKTKLVEERQQQLADLNKYKKETANKESELQAQIEKLTGEVDAQNKLTSDLQQQIDQLTKAKEEQGKLAEERQGQIDQLTKAKDEQEPLAAEKQKKIEWLTKARDEQAALAEERKSQIVQLTKARDEQKLVAEERQATIDKLSSESTQQVSQISEMLKLQQGQLEKMEKGLKDQIDNKIVNSTHQIESLIGIESYMGRGQLLPTLHGWTVSPDFAHYLINLIEDNDYDLIIEFGSGSTTVLMAKALMKKNQRAAIQHFFQQREMKTDSQLNLRSEFENLLALTMPAFSDQAMAIPHEPSPRIVAFEHHQHYYGETLKALRQAGVDDLVDLHLAPLRDYNTWEGEHFLYYGCEERIADLAKFLNGRRGKILVLVDGPPGATGKHARYPALPILLQHLATHGLDILLDDFSREDEKEIVERWEFLLGKRSLTYEKKNLGFEKGACLLSIS